MEVKALSWGHAAPCCLTLNYACGMPSFHKEEEALPLFQENKEFLPQANKLQEWRPEIHNQGPPISWGSGAQRWGDTPGHRQFLFLRPAPTPVPQLSWLQSIIVLGAHLHSGGSSPEGSHRQV